MNDREKVIESLRACSIAKCCTSCPYAPHENNCIDALHLDVLELLKEQDEIIDALLKVGYPHNFQREEPWIVNYMLNITDVLGKAVRLRNGEVKQDE